jgi:hypothetical protein
MNKIHEEIQSVKKRRMLGTKRDDYMLGRNTSEPTFLESHGIKRKERPAWGWTDHSVDKATQNGYWDSNKISETVKIQEKSIQEATNDNSNGIRNLHDHIDMNYGVSRTYGDVSHRFQTLQFRTDSERDLTSAFCARHCLQGAKDSFAYCQRHKQITVSNPHGSWIPRDYLGQAHGLVEGQCSFQQLTIKDLEDNLPKFREAQNRLRRFKLIAESNKTIRESRYDTANNEQINSV